MNVKALPNGLKTSFLIALIIFTVTAALVSCSDSDTPSDETDETAAAEMFYVDPSNYIVIRAERASDAVIQYAVDVRVALQDATGATIPITNDFDYIFRTDLGERKVLLLGDTTYKYTDADGVEHVYNDESAAGLGTNDYAITSFADGTIAINAGSESALEAAVDYFFSDMLKDGKIVLSAEVSRTTGSYTPPPEPVYQYNTVDITFAEDAPSDMPAVYIVLDDEVDYHDIPRNEYIPATFALDGKGFVDNKAETPLLIKGRGNYSWGFSKKPYNLKFDSKINLGGLGAAKKWTLVSTYSDKTMLRNFITLNLGLEAGIECSMECFYVNLYLNGNFRGVYLMTERIQIHEERVNIHPETGAALFEIEMTYRHSDCSKCIELDSGTHMMLIDPELDDELDDGTVVSADVVDEMLTNSEKVLQKADTAMKKGWDEYSPLIDIDSFTEWYIVNEFVKNYDSRFVTSCYCYIGDDGKVYMGPPWDYDTCMGNQEVMTCINPEGWHVSDAMWYSILLKDEDFWTALCDKWAELRDNGVILDNFLARVTEFTSEKTESIAANNERWPDTLLQSGLRGGKSLYTYDEEVDYLVNWVTKRTEWLDEQFGYNG